MRYTNQRIIGSERLLELIVGGQRPVNPRRAIPRRDDTGHPAAPAATSPAGTPASPATDPAATPPAGAPATPAAPAAADPATDPWADPTKAKAEIERLRAENARDRTAAKDTAAKEARDALIAEITKALGGNTNEAPTVEQLTKQLTETNSGRETAEQRATSAELQLAVYLAAQTAGADGAALIDSTSFMTKVAALQKDHATDAAAFTQAVSTAIAEAVKNNPKLAAAPAAGKGGADTPGGSGEGASTLDAQIAEAEKNGDHMLAIRLKRQKAFATT